jgi:hypothetical protein
MESQTLMPTVGEALAIAQLRELLGDRATEAGKLEIDARRCEQRGQLQLAGELRTIARRLTRIHQAATRGSDISPLSPTEHR